MLEQASIQTKTKPIDAHVIPYALYEMAMIYAKDESVSYFETLFVFFLLNIKLYININSSVIFIKDLATKQGYFMQSEGKKLLYF